MLDPAGAANVPGKEASVPPREFLRAYGYNGTHMSQYNFAMPDLYRYAVCISILLAVFAVFDFLVAHRTKARYFAIHVLANAIVVVFCAPTMYLLISDPLPTLASDRFSYWAMSSNLAVHIYHVVAFNDLVLIDWLHHGISVGLFCPGIIAHDKFLGPLIDMNTFFLCGLPGGIDYAMLFAVKHGWMHPLSEKKYNAMLNTWIRAPGSVASSAWSWLVLFAKNPVALVFHPARIIELSLIVMNLWNAQFFMSRVVANFHLRAYQAKQREAAQNVGNK